MTETSVPSGPHLDELIEQGLSEPTGGWDFSRFGDRLRSIGGDGRYPLWVADALRNARTAADLGTGGGEFLAGLPCHAEQMQAVEAWPPNVPVAAGRLRPQGIPVVQAAGVPDNVDLVAGQVWPRLPLRSGSMDVIVNRHESFLAAELLRVLRPGGVFVTEQVGLPAWGDLERALDWPAAAGDPWNADVAAGQLREAGLEIIESAEFTDTIEIADVAVLVWFLRQIPWALPGFDPTREKGRLAAAAARMPLLLTEPLFVIRACCPGPAGG